jgi:formamidopyrimidine-DNA glycosylase
VPEVLEVELYRRLADSIIGRRVTAVMADDPIVVTPAGGFNSLIGTRVDQVLRHGKLMSIVFAEHTKVVDLHFGMTGRLIVDGQAALDSLVYGASDNDRWARFALRFEHGGLIMSDPRRFSRVRWRDEESATFLGPDVFTVSVEEFVSRLESRSRSSLKAVLLDQRVLAGLGNMLVDEILLRASFDPRRRVESVNRQQLEILHQVMSQVLPELLARGGSHAGLLEHSLRRPGAPCPRDGSPMVKMVVAGRTTFVCPVHQHIN